MCLWLTQNNTNNVEFGTGNRPNQLDAFGRHVSYPARAFGVGTKHFRDCHGPGPLPTGYKHFLGFWVWFRGVKPPHS